MCMPRLLHIETYRGLQGVDERLMKLVTSADLTTLPKPHAGQAETNQEPARLLLLKVSTSVLNMYLYIFIEYVTACVH